MTQQLQPLFGRDGNPIDYSNPEALLADVLNIATESTGFQKTMNLDEIAGEWVLITNITGPFRIPSQFSTDADGKSNVLVMECARNLDGDLRGVVEQIPINQIVLYNYFNNPTVRAFFSAGGELGCKFSVSRTKNGMKLWLFEVCRTSELEEKLFTSMRDDEQPNLPPTSFKPKK